MSRQPGDWDRWIAKHETSGSTVPATILEIERWLLRLPEGARGRVADLGCGLGLRLPLLASRFGEVFTVEDALGLSALPVRLDVIVAIDTIVGPQLADFDGTLETIRRRLVEGGLLLGTFPAAPKHTILRAMLLDRGEDTPAPDVFHEVELQYRLQRAGLRGTVIRRIADNTGAESLVCRAVRRADN